MSRDPAAGGGGATRVAELFDLYRAAIFAYIFRLAGDRELAEELTQETFVKVLSAQTPLAEIQNQRAWLYRIATNTTFTALKRRRRFAWLPWAIAEALAPRQPDLPAYVGQRAVVEAALAALAPPYRATLLLYSHYGFSVGEIAESLEISAGAVKTRLYRAREMFARAYARENRDEQAF